MTSFTEVPLDFRRHFSSWVRLEPRCRDDDFAQGLEARVNDPLWMIARQWQMAEFKGENAASPYRIEVDYENFPINELVSGNDNVVSLTGSSPLEVLVEHEPFKMNWRTRIQIGQQFEKNNSSSCAYQRCN